ncbi:MAG: AbrB/MazE/SpoVT family DNA-binding domain-containing protein [Synergistaceae bacterium]|nr:AbrB/MazE/SpoVT family DNA-binding domain-containing protein [Synergistaceae bacterium]
MQIHKKGRERVDSCGFTFTFTDTISAPVVSSLGLKEGDQLEIFADNGKISMIPVAVYPDDYVEQLRRETAELRDNIKSGKQPVFDSVDSLIDALESI